MILQFKDQYKFLSNFYPARISLTEIPEIPGFPVIPTVETYGYSVEANTPPKIPVFPTVENAYQALKSRQVSTYGEFLWISPATAKKMGRRVKLRPDFEPNKLAVMEALLRVKFKDPNLMSLLRSTGDQLLVEGNTWGDRYWGISMPSGDPKGLEELPSEEIIKILSKYGQNHLGRILMKIRDPDYVDEWGILDDPELPGTCNTQESHSLW